MQQTELERVCIVCLCLCVLTVSGQFTRCAIHNFKFLALSTRNFVSGAAPDYNTIHTDTLHACKTVNVKCFNCIAYKSITVCNSLTVHGACKATDTALGPYAHFSQQLSK